jgi:hypothetical protein
MRERVLHGVQTALVGFKVRENPRSNAASLKM